MGFNKFYVRRIFRRQRIIFIHAVYPMRFPDTEAEVLCDTGTKRYIGVLLSGHLLRQQGEQSGAVQVNQFHVSLVPEREGLLCPLVRRRQLCQQ